MATRESVSVGEVTISYLRAGDGPPLVMLHGIGGNATQFIHQLDGLADTATLIAWDAPGYGDSSDPDETWLMPDYARTLRDFLDALSLDRVALLGQSWGGSLAQTFTGLYPERVSKLILSDASMGGRSQPEEVRLATLNGRLAALESMTPAELAVARAPAVLGPNPSAEVTREAETMMAAIRPAGYRRAAIALAEVDARQFHAGIAMPTLVIGGEHDKVTPPSGAAALADAIPSARLVTIPGVGHLSGQEDPATYNTVLSDFLRASTEC